MKTLVIIGSSRKDGHTRQAVDKLKTLLDLEIIDLNDYRIDYYDYGHKNKDDDYLELIRKIIDQYDLLIFATPVYWYAMSGVMKVFFDRLTDLLDHEQALRKKLKTKKMAVLTSSGGDHLGEHFWLPFKETARYLGMNYLGNIHTTVDQDQTTDLKEFAERIKREF